MKSFVICARELVVTRSREKVEPAAIFRELARAFEPAEKDPFEKRSHDGPAKAGCTPAVAS